MINKGDIIQIHFFVTYLRDNRIVNEENFYMEGKIKEFHKGICLVELIIDKTTIWVRRMEDKLFLHTIKEWRE